MRLRWTVSVRLAATTAVSFLAAGALLLALNFALVERQLPGEELTARPLPGTVAPVTGCPGPACPDADVRISSAVADATRALRDRTLDELVTQSLWTLLAATVLAAALGWLIARRAVRPVRDITAAARTISEKDLHQRLRATGPDDELRELADTFDDMLARLDAAFSAQQRFAAAASHELRTPVAVQRTLIDVALADPDVDRDRLLVMAERLRTVGQRQERVIEGLLTLARTTGPVDRADRCDLGDLVEEAVAAVAEEVRAGGLTVRIERAAAPVVGDAALLGRLVGNLVENAVRHNRPGGGVVLRSGGGGGRSSLTVENDGASLVGVDVEELFEPFRRGGSARVDADRGSGLGLSVARSIAQAHGGTVVLRARPAGGIAAVLDLPAAPAPTGTA